MNIQLTRAISKLFNAYFLGEGVDKDRANKKDDARFVKTIQTIQQCTALLNPQLTTPKSNSDFVSRELDLIKEKGKLAVDKAREKGEKYTEEVAAVGKQMSQRGSLVLGVGGLGAAVAEIGDGSNRAGLLFGGGGGGKKGKGHKKSKSSDNVGVGIGIGIGAGAGDIDSSHTAARPRSRGHVRATCDDEKLGVEQSVDAKVSGASTSFLLFAFFAFPKMNFTNQFSCVVSPPGRARVRQALESWRYKRPCVFVGLPGRHERVRNSNSSFQQIAQGWKLELPDHKVDHSRTARGD